MKRSHKLDRHIALFLADSAEVSERLSRINQRLVRVLNTLDATQKEKLYRQLVLNKEFSEQSGAVDTPKDRTSSSNLFSNDSIEQ